MFVLLFYSEWIIKLYSLSRSPFFREQEEEGDADELLAFEKDVAAQRLWQSFQESATAVAHLFRGIHTFKIDTIISICFDCSIFRLSTEGRAVVMGTVSRECQCSDSIVSRYVHMIITCITYLLCVYMCMAYVNIVKRMF